MITEWTKQREISWWLAPCLLLPAVLALPAAAGRVLLFRDILHFALPQQAFAVAARNAFRLPLWDPGRYGGAPFLAEPGSGFFYPPNLLFHLLDPARAATFFVLLHLPIAGAGAYLLARRLDCKAPAAALAACGYAASGYLLSMHGGHYYFASAALLPGVCAALLHARSPRSLAVAAFAVALAAFNGEMQALFFAAAIAAALSLCAPADRARGAAWAAGALALGLALGSAQLIPSALFARGTLRAGGLSLHEAGLWALHPLRLVELFVAAPFGLPWPENGYWGSAVLTGTHALPWAVSLYLGPALMVPALAAGWPRETQRRALALLAVAALLLAAGPRLPFFRWWMLAVPLADHFRYPEKYALVATLALCLLGGRAAQELAAAPRRAAAGFSACAALLAVASAIVFARPAWLEEAVARGLEGAQANVAAQEALTQLFRSLLQGALLCAVLAAGAAASRRRPALLLPLLLFAAAISQASHGAAALSWGDGSFLRREPAFVSPWRAAIAPGTTGRVLNDGSCRFRGEGSGSLLERVRAFEWNHGKENFPLLFGLRESLGYGAAENARQVALVQRLLPSGLEPTARALGAAAIAGCTSGDLRVTPLRDPLPRLAVDGDGARATLLDDRPERARISARGPGLLVFAENHAPGWTATVDGSPSPILETAALFRSVQLPAGDHEVVFEYAAPGLRTGAIVTALALLACLALLKKQDLTAEAQRAQRKPGLDPR